MRYGKFLDELGDLYEWRRKNNLPDQHYKKTFADLRDIWIKDKRYSELIAFIHENWDSGNGDDFFNPLSTHLIKENELSYYKKLWKGVLRHRINNLWYRHKFILQEYPNITLDEIKATDIKGFNQFSSKESVLRRLAWERKYTLKGIEEYKQGLIRLNDSTEIEKVENLYKSIYNLNKPRPKKSTDKRKIDENVFWDLIKINREKSEDKFDFIENLSNQLEEFKPTEIKRFERTFLSKYNELIRWEIWALAYIARRGCGDDAFDYFKAWVISKGKETFEDVKNLKVSELKKHFDEDPQLEEMFSLAENVYENKTGELMSPVRVKKQKLTGKQWKEENLEKDFPDIWKIFEHKITAPNNGYE